MRQRRYEYDFFDRGDSCKLVVEIGRNAARIVIAVGGRLWADSYPLSVAESTDGVVRIGGNVFAPDEIACDLTVGGMRIEAFSSLVPLSAFPSQWGPATALGVTRYTVAAPAVGGTAGGIFVLDGTRWEHPFVCVHTIVGDDTDLPHTVVTGAGQGCALMLAFGRNTTFGRAWTYARAQLFTPEHTYFLGAPARLKDCAERPTEIACTVRTPAVSLSVAVRAPQVAVDALGTSICDSARAEITVVSGTGRIRGFSCPAVWSRRGLRPTGEAERAPSGAVREPADD